MKDILERLLAGEIDIPEAEKLLKVNNILEFDDIAKFDIKRKSRTGFPEAVFSPSKDYEDLITIIKNYLKNSKENLIITKLSPERYEKILNDIDTSYPMEYNKRAEILVIRREPKEKPITKCPLAFGYFLFT